MGNKGLAIKSDVLKKELKKRGLTASEASRKIGYKCPTALSKAMSSASMTPMTIAALQREYNIDPNLYVIKEEEPEAKEEKTVSPTIEIEKFADIRDDLYRVIYGAVYAAVKKALAE